jgi:1-acyl-sn-glycerol-3-phosphate acyltransferase
MELVYPPVILTARTLFAGLGLKFVQTGNDFVPKTGGAVLASNHVSYLDFTFCGFAAYPQKRLVRFMAKDAIFKNPVAGPLMRGMHHIPVDRSAGAASFREALTALNDGEIVGIFPEATISKTYRPKDFKSGAARLAIEAGVPLIPMATWGGQRIYTKGRKPKADFGTTVMLTVGEPLYPGPDDDAVEVTKVLKSRIEALVNDSIERYPTRPAPGTWWWPADLGGGAPARPDAGGRTPSE